MGMKTGELGTIGFWCERTKSDYRHLRRRLEHARAEPEFTLDGQPYYDWAVVFEALNGRPWCQPAEGSEG